MTDSATTSLRLRKQSLGSNLNTWGDPNLNTDLDLIDAAIASQAIVTFAGTATSTSTTLTSSNYSSDQSRVASLLFNGTSTTNQTVVIPSVAKTYDVINSMTITGTLFLQPSGGNSGAVPARNSRVVTDGTSITVMRDTDYATTALENVGVGTGTAYAAPAYWVSSATSSRSMGGNQINNLGTGSANADAVNVGQMNSAIAVAGVPAASGAVKLNASDAASDYLGNKVVGSAPVVVSTITSGTTGQLQISMAAFTGATSTSAGTAGAVPAPASSTSTLYLSNLGTFAAVQAFDPVLNHIFA